MVLTTSSMIKVELNLFVKFKHFVLDIIFNEKRSKKIQFLSLLMLFLQL
jgi:hypothetical protein